MKFVEKSYLERFFNKTDKMTPSEIAGVIYVLHMFRCIRSDIYVYIHMYMHVYIYVYVYNIYTVLLIQV